MIPEYFVSLLLQLQVLKMCKAYTPYFAEISVNKNPPRMVLGEDLHNSLIKSKLITDVPKTA